MAIVVNICGGLGNQMFQYAFGRHLAIRNQSSLKLDTRFINPPSQGPYYDYRNFLLDRFNIEGEIAKLDFLSNIYNKEEDYSFLHENKYCFDPYKLEAKGNVYVSGYWQSPLYFSDIKQLIKKEFLLKNEPDNENAEIANKIFKSNSVSIHIRRGDYVKNEELNKSFGVCSMDYYKKAARVILSRVKEPFFFIFSDDIHWASQNINFIKSPTIFVSNNNTFDESYEDLRLMSLCKHNIIANSTFSWWAAYLNTNGNKVIIGPRKWFQDSFYFNVDLLPVEWKLI